jgi:hypothetical protein
MMLFLFTPFLYILICLKPRLHSDWAVIWMIWVSNPGRNKRFFLFFKNVQTDSGAHPASYSVDAGGFFSDDKVAGV